ncbi:Vacuolar protein sorting-associated protein 13D [Sparganum proliferum]
MLIGLVSAVLRRSLGRYVENIDNDKLSYSLYQGQVALNDLVLKPEALTHLLGLPIKLRSGKLGRVLLQIPITQLRSQPWCITIEGVQLQVSSEDDDEEGCSAQNLDAAETPEAKKARLWQAKKAYLDRLESRWWQIVQQGGMAGATAVASTGCPLDSSWWSYGVSLVYGIIRNLQVEIKDVQFSFVGEAALHEPSDSSPLVPFNWGVRLKQLSAQTTDEFWDSSKRPENDLIEYKAINIVDLSVYWIPNKSNDTTTGIGLPEEEPQYLLPPSQFSIHLKRQTTPEPLTSDPRIEVEASLAHLRLQLSNSAYRLTCGFLTYLNRRFSASRRPRVRPSQQPKAWWLYAAGEVVPTLRSRFRSESEVTPVTDLPQLVTEATRTHSYVHAYEEHLLQGLCLTNGHERPADSQRSVDLQQVEESMQLERITLLRQVAMQRAARRLCAYAVQHDGRMPAVRSEVDALRHATDLVPSAPVPSVPASASAASWWPQFLSSTNGAAVAAPADGKGITASAPTATNTTSWRLWWWWNTTPPSAQSMNVPADAEATLKAPDDSAEPPPSAAASTTTMATVEVPPAEATEAALGLLNELVSAEDVDQVLFRDRLFCRATLLVCQCHFTLTGDAISDSEPLLSVTGENLHFGLETRPRHQSLRFTVGLRSLTIMDERRRRSPTDTSCELRPLLPLVVVPQSSCTSSDEKRGLFWLAYELNPLGLASASSLKVRTDRLRIVYQPELFLQVVKFFQWGNLQSERVAAANTYTAIMARTEANLRAVIHNADAEDELLPPELPTDKSESVKLPAFRESSQWLLDFDIAAPNILFADRLWPIHPSSREEKASVLGVLCDLGHFHLSNKATEVSHESKVDEKIFPRLSQTTSFLDWESIDEEDAFATPCGSREASDNEAEEMEDEDEINRTKVDATQRRPSQGPSRPKKLYETYILRLDDLRVLAGRIGDLQKSGLWTEADNSGSTLDPPHWRRTADHLVTSPALSRVHLIDRFSLTAWIAKRVHPMAVLSSLRLGEKRALPPGVPSDLPGLLVSWEQHQCVLRLSDAKVDALRQCVSAALNYSLPVAEDSSTSPASAVSTATSRPHFTSLPRPRQQQEHRIHRSQSTMRRRTVSRSISSASTTPPLPPVLRRRILITFRMQELILQMDSNDRPLAECRLTNTTAGFARSTGTIECGLVEYQARAQVHSLTIADAVSGLGGDFDLLAASHRGVRMDTLSGHLKLASDANTPPQSARERKLTPGEPHLVPVHPPFFDPFAENEADTTTTLIRVFYTCIRPPIDDPVRFTERRLDVKFSCLDLLGNQQTLCELISFFRRMVPTPHTESTARSRGNSRSTSEAISDHLDHTPAPVSSHLQASENGTADSGPSSLDLFVYVERLSLVLIRVPQCRLPRRAEYLATATLLGANFEWHHDSSDTYHVSLEGMQVLDLSSSNSNHRHIFAAGSCLDPELGQSLPLTHMPPQEHVLKISCQRHRQQLPASPVENLSMHIEIANPVYVHKPQALQDIGAWFSSLPQVATRVARRLRQRLRSAAGRVARKVVLEDDGSRKEEREAPVACADSGAFNFTSFHLSLAQPVLVLPQSSTSPLVLIGRLGHLRMVSDVVGRPVIRMSIERASLTSLDVGTLPSVWGTSEAVRAMLELAHFRGLVKSKSEFQVLEDISSNLMLSKCKTILPKSTASCSKPFNWPVDFDVESLKIPYLETESNSFSALEPSSVVGDSSREVTWLMAEACLTQPLHMRLTKQVYQQVLRSVDNLVAEEKPESEVTTESAEVVDQLPTEEEEDGELPLSAILGLHSNFPIRAAEEEQGEIATAADKSRLLEKVPFLAMQFRMPLLVVETFAQVDVNPTGLARLTLSDFFISASQSSGGLRRVNAHLAGLTLENLLPELPSQGQAERNGELTPFLENQTAPPPPKATGSQIVRTGRKCRYQRGLGWMVADSCPNLQSLLPIENSDDRFELDKGQKQASSAWMRYDPRATWTLKGVAKSLQKTGPHALWSTERWYTDEGEQGHCKGRRRSSISSLHSLATESTKEHSMVKTQLSAAPPACQQFVRIRVLYVDPKRLNFSTKYNSQRRFVDVAFSSLTCRLSLHPWVLLLDFLGFESPLSACDDFNREPRADNSAPSALTSAADTSEGLLSAPRGLQEEPEDAETEENTVVSLSVTSFTLLLTVTPCVITSRDTLELANRPHEADFLRLSASSLLLHLMSHSRSVLNGGNWMALDGELGEVLVEDLSPSGRLYPQRFVTAPLGWQESTTTGTPGDTKANSNFSSSQPQNCLLTFSLKRYTLPDPQLTRREEEAVLSVRLAPAYYVHTQAFLTTVTDILERFLQYQDLMNRVSASSKGLKVRSVPPISSRIRLDIDAHSPIIVLPVCSESESALVCDLGHLTAVNAFVWDGDPGSLSFADTQESGHCSRCGGDDGHTPVTSGESGRQATSAPTDHIMPTRNLQDCPHCIQASLHSSSERQEVSSGVGQSHFSASQPHEMPAIFAPSSAETASTETNDAVYTRCLLDCIDLNLTEIEIYVGRRRPQTEVLTHPIPGTSAESDAKRTRTLCFRDFYIAPLERAASATAASQSQPWRRLTDPFELRVRVERNLSASRCRMAPDWRLSAKLQLLTVHVELADYTLLRGILAHNLSEENPSLPSEAATKRNTLTRSTTEAQASPPRSDTVPSCTQRPWRVFAFNFDLQDVSIHFAVPPDWPSLRMRPTDGAGSFVNFCRLDFIRSQLAYEKFSDNRRNTELSCSAVNFGDTRFDDLAESPPNLFTTILTSINPAEEHTQTHHQPQLPQFRITNVEDYNHSCMTYYLRSMRLILAFDWLCDLHRFLTTPPDSAFQVDQRTSKNNVFAQSVVPPPDIGRPASPETSELRLYADQSEFVLLENPSDIETNAVILAGAACFFLSRSTAPEEWIARAPDGVTSRQRTDSKRLGLRLHGVSVHTRCFSNPDSASADAIVEPADVDIQLGPELKTSANSAVSSTGAGGLDMGSGVGAAHGFRSAGLQDLLTPRLVLKISTSSIRTHFSYTDSQLFLALLSSLQEQASSAFAASSDCEPARQVPSPTDLDESIARLMGMGFSWEQACMQAKVLQGDSQSALLNLMLPMGRDLDDRQTLPEKGPPPSSITVCRLKQIFEYLSPSISVLHFKSNFSLCLIDDCLDADVPLAEIILSDISAKWCLTGWAVGRGKARLAVNYYNRDLSALEPAVEPFLCIFDWRLSADDRNGDLGVFEIHSPDTVNINLTVPLVRLTRLVMEKTRQERAAILEASKSSPTSRTARRRVPFVPFRLSNQTGSRLWFRALTEGSAAEAGVGLETPSVRDAEWFSVPPNAPPVDLPFRSAMEATPRCGRPRTRMLTQQRRTSPRLILLVAGWQPTYPVAVDRLGIFFRTIQLVPTRSTETSDLADCLLPPRSTFTRLVIEVVRRGSAQNLIIVRSGLTVTNRLSTDFALEVGLDPSQQRPPAAAASVAPAHLGSAPPPVGGPRGIIPALRVPFGETAAVPLDLAARASLGFGRFCIRPVCVAAARKSYHFSWSDMTPLRRPSRSEHQQSDRIQGRYATKDALNWLNLTKPGDFSECVVVCRRLTSGSQLGLLSATTSADSMTLTSGLPRTASDCFLSQQQQQRSQFKASQDDQQSQLRQWQLCVTVVRDAFPPDPLLARGHEAALVLPGHHFTVGPALRVVNLLPFDMVYFLEGCPIRGCIAPNKTASVFEVGCADTLRFGVHLEGFDRCEPLIIPPSAVSHQVLMRLRDAHDRPLELQVKVSSRAFGARHLTVSAVCWLINQSGLPLVFAQTAPSTLVTANELRPASPAYRSLAAGQSTEQEFARLAIPLLFSFPNKEEDERLQARIGVKYDPSGGHVADGSDLWMPRWSPSINLSKTGVDLLRLRIKSTGDRPDLLYSIGVEVRKGRGPHNVTTMVTFTPRFVISNETNLRLQFAQRFCLESSTDKSVVMDTQPHCSLSFHWPRQDLDQLLCVRALIPNGSNGTSKDSYVTTHWSGGMQIDVPRSYTLKLRLPRRSASSASTAALFTGTVPDSLFLRVSIVLRSATFFVIVTDASKLPPLYRIENRSLVSLFYLQAIGGAAGDGMLPAELSQGDWQSGRNGHWSGGVVQCTLGPRSWVNYAPDEPLLPALLSVGVQGSLSRTYDLDKLGPGSRLVYDNYAYLTTCGAADDSASLYSTASFEYPVFDVTPRSKRVVLNLKRPGERSQLWYLSDTGHILHEGSAVPCEPTSRERQHLSRRSWVLDVDTSTPAVDAIRNHVPSIDSTTLENFEIGILCLSPFSRRRSDYQVWHLDERGFLVNDASFCVQAARDLDYRTLQSNCSSLPCLLGGSILVARPRRGANCLVSKILSAAKIMTAWLRPGSGSLDVEVVADGPVKVLLISDSYEQPLPASSMQSCLSPLLSPTMDLSRTVSPTSLKVLLDFPAGVGISIVSGFSEELCYASFIGLRLSLDRIYPGGDTVPRSVKASNRASSGNFEFGEDLTEALEDAVFVDDAPMEQSVADKPSLPRLRIRTVEDSFSSDIRSPTEQVRLHIQRIQVDSQFPGATLPILLFRSVPSSQARGTITHTAGRGIVQGRPMQHDPTWIRGRELFRLLEAGDRPIEDETCSAAAERETQWLAPLLVQRHVRLLNTGWEAQIFTLFEVNLNKLVIQAEETLLLKLIQFGRNFYNDVQPLQTNFEDARYLDLIATKPALFTGEVEGTYARQLSPPVVQTLDCFYFGRLRIYIAPLRVTVQTAKGKLGPEFHDVKRLLPKLMSFADAELRLDPLDRHHFLECGPYLLDQLLMHYQLQLRAQALRIFGSVDFLGNPLGFLNDISAGISGLVEMDVGGLVRNVVHGVGDSTAKVVGSMSQLVHAISMDERHQRQRSAILGSQDDNIPQLREGSDPSDVIHQSNSHASGLSEIFEDYELIDSVPSTTSSGDDDRQITAPLAAGFRGFVHGVFGGVTSMVTQPYHGVREDNFKGFVYGVGRGLLGTVAKPVGGVLDLVTGAMTTLREAARSSSYGRPRRRRPRRAGLSPHRLPLLTYSLAAAVCQLQLRRLAASLPDDRFRSTNPVVPHATETTGLETGEDVGESN